FQRWDKTYPIEFQIQSIMKGRNLPLVSVLVDCMFHSELKNRLLTSGHDLDQIIGNLFFDVTVGNEEYLKIDGKSQQLKIGDILLRDENDILANILYGPAKRTSITMDTKNALYFAWCPDGILISTIENHLQEILSTLEKIYGKILSEVSFYLPNSN
ncbi:MAG: phenylalanine--tRNA ligase beta subunit-related protein, partial [Candidatus Thorarchaeota archaeon]